MLDQMGGMMMWGMGLIWVLLVIVLVLAAAALVKYLISK
jgi:type IV secretory pathway VirB2 component (pilin)